MSTGPALKITSDSSDSALLHGFFQAALKAALPDGQFRGKLPERPKGRTLVLGAGKAAARMAEAFETAWESAGGACEGLVVTRYGHGVPTRFIKVVEAAHPVPDQAGLDAARRILSLAREAGPDDLVICLMSGGASALLSLPADGITLEDKQDINRKLLRSGAPIDQMNIVRKALSAIKGGRLAAAVAPARLVTYLISDVPGDDPASIGSGPTIPESSDADEALAILRRYAIAIPDRVAVAMRANSATLGAGGEVHMLATPKMALDAAADLAESIGIRPLILGDAIEGEAREVARVMAGIARSVVEHGVPVAAPCVLLSGGETTVTMQGEGRGGRNGEFLLALAIAVEGIPGISALACDTDGIDGSEENAGAWFDLEIYEAARAKNIDLRSYLDQNDAFTAFDALDRLVITGPTLTNVNDFRCVLIR